MKRWVFFLSLVLCLSFNSFTFAQVSLDKREIKLDIQPGQETKGFIVVNNSSDKDVTLKTYFEDIEYKFPYLGTPSFLPLGSTPQSCGKWINLSPELVLIPAKSKQEVSYSIKVPSTIKGGYYGILWLERVAVPITGEKGVSLIIREGCKFFLETPDKIKEGKIDDIAVDKNSIKGDLLNSGNVLLISQGTFYIMNEKNIVSDRGDIQKFYLPEKAKVSFIVKVSKNVTQGKNTLFINFDLGAGKALVKEIDFSKDAAGNLKILKMRD